MIATELVGQWDFVTRFFCIPGMIWEKKLYLEDLNLLFPIQNNSFHSYH